MTFRLPTIDHPAYKKGIVTPESMAKTNSEDSHQMAVNTWAHLPWVRERWPVLEFLHHIPNGGSRGDTAKSRAIAGGAMKAMGTLPGVPDLFLPVPMGGYHGLYVELKKPALRPKTIRKPGTKPAGASEEQWRFGQFAMSVGYGWIVCYSWDEIRDVIIAYLEQPVTP